MRRKLIALILLIGLPLPLTSHAFDGQRKGFVIGGGGGVSPVAHWSWDRDDQSENLVGFNLQVLIGFAWDNHNVLVYQGPPTLSKSNYFEDELVFQGVWAIRAYHYFGDRGSSSHMNLGLGRAVYTVFDTNLGGDGIGFVIGGGYEFMPHVQVGLDLLFGHSKDEGTTISHSTLALSIVAAAY